MAKAGEELNLATLFTELNKFGQNQDYEKALVTSNKILKEAPEDVTAFHCKIVCLLHLDKFEDALTAIFRNTQLSRGLSFEKAYCQYRLNRTSDALVTIETVPDPDLRLEELHAQVLYRLERFEECFALYKNLMKNTQDEYDDERETNLSAVMAALQLSSPSSDLEDLGLREETYEMCYNKACFLIGKRQYKQAEEMLRQSEELCRKTLEDDPDNTEEDIEEELGLIRVQLAYTLQMLGKTEQALKLYNQVVKQKPSDQALIAVASNNIVTLNKDQNVFDSKKKIKVATADNLKQKLTCQQRELIAINQGLLYLYTNQNEQCRKHCKSLISMYPDSETPPRILAAQHCNDKQIAKAIDVLKEYTSSHPDASMTVHLTLAQLYLAGGSVFNACDALKAMGEDRYAPGIVAALVSLYKSQEDNDSAVDVLSDAIGWYRKNEPSSTNLPTLMHANASLLMELGRPEGAASVLETLKKSNPRDASTLAQLIAAYSKFDQKKAQAISRELPSPQDLANSVDAATLETSFTTLKSKYSRKAGKGTDNVPSPKASGASGDTLLEKRKKKKKKKRLPKTYDSSVDPDPERWLPRRERSYYKAKRKDKRKEIGKGTQGAGMVSAELDASKPSPTTPKSTPTTTESPREQAAGPRQQKPQAASKKKKKKGKGGW